MLAEPVTTQSPDVKSQMTLLRGPKGAPPVEKPNIEPKRKGPMARPIPPTENVSELADAKADGWGMAAGTMASRSLVEKVTTSP